jgi:hypothetical protein
MGLLVANVTTTHRLDDGNITDEKTDSVNIDALRSWVSITALHNYMSGLEAHIPKIRGAEMLEFGNFDIASVLR